jgi:tRNA pseudouridine38-40 synthase
MPAFRVRCVVEYDGTDFAGWQRQSRQRSVEGVLEQAVAAVTGAQTVRVVGAGRTDAGVHATGQVAHFDTVWTGALNRLERALNAVMPPDVAVHGVEMAPDEFHARHSAIGRHYRYTIWQCPVRSPLLRRTSLHVPQVLDVDSMVAAARAIVGEHDFGAFGVPPTSGGSTVRRLERLAVRAGGPRLDIDLEATAFLRHQVRRTVGLLVDIGRGRFAPGVVCDVLARCPDAPVPRRLPPQGLVLVAVRYPLAMGMFDPRERAMGTRSEW